MPRGVCGARMASFMSGITEVARPKVNLTLKVSGRRQDGYHEIESLIVFAAGLGDVVRLVPGNRTSLLTSGPFASAITGENLITAALARLAEVAPEITVGSVMLEKHLPVAAGIGGGSADAAAILRAVCRANPGRAKGLDWPAIAASLGADVPVCLADTPAFVMGIGEITTPLPHLPCLPAVLVNPLAPTPADKTAQVFSRFAAPFAPETRHSVKVPHPFEDVAALLDFMGENPNDLMSTAEGVVPEIRGVRAALAGADGCAYAGLSGAGPTCFGIFDSDEAAVAAVNVLRQSNPQWWIAATQLGG